MYDSTQPTKDEKQIKDFMVSKYEKKLYYSDPVSQKPKNGIQSNPTITTTTTTYQVMKFIWILSWINNINSCIYFQKPSSISNPTPAIDISPNKFEFFKEDFSNQNPSPTQASQSFANFDNNPAFPTSFESSTNIGMYSLFFSVKLKYT